MLGIAAIPSLALAFGIVKMTESPRWLVMQGRLGDAKKILLQVSNTKEEAEARFRDIKTAAGIDENCLERMLSNFQVRIAVKGFGKNYCSGLLLQCVGF